MPKQSLSKLEKAHLAIQILAQATTIIAAIVVAIWGYYSTVKHQKYPNGHGYGFMAM